MHRFYCPSANFSSLNISITDKNEIHHLKNVLRFKKNDPLVIFNNREEEALGKILSISPSEVTVEINSVRKNKVNTPALILACAIPKKGKLETIIEKTTELGVTDIIPLLTKRTEVKLTGNRADNKQKRYNSVAINAAKQCRRQNIPLIHPVSSFDAAFKYLSKTTSILIPSLEKKTIPLIEALSSLDLSKNIALFIGPEGDFTPEEYRLASQTGCIPVSLGRTILKVETAAIASVACTMLFLHSRKYL